MSPHPAPILPAAPHFNWHALLERWVPGDPYQPEPGTERYYDTKARIAAWLQPARILEIGVRAGYSALAFHMGFPFTHYTGLDVDQSWWGGVAGYMDEARTRLEGLCPSCALLTVDTQSLDTLPHPPHLAHLSHLSHLSHLAHPTAPGRTCAHLAHLAHPTAPGRTCAHLAHLAHGTVAYDMAHVDGDHSFKGALHDICLCLDAGVRVVVVDDYDFLPSVRQAADYAVAARGLRSWYVGDGGYRGNLVIENDAWPSAPDLRRRTADAPLLSHACASAGLQWCATERATVPPDLPAPVE